MTLTAIIIDDEKPSRENLSAIIKNYFPNINLINEVATIQEASDVIKLMKPDLLFLDMNLGEDTGFDLLARFPNPEFDVIFVTAYHEFASKAFRTIATDYILKPVDLDELKEAIDKVIEKVKYRNLKGDSDKNKSRNHTESMGFLKVYSANGNEIINHDDILYLQSINFYTKIVLQNNKELISTKHLKDYEAHLKNYRFFRIHNSFIINILHLKAVTQNEGYNAILSDDIILKISRRRKEEFLLFLETHK